MGKKRHRSARNGTCFSDSLGQIVGKVPGVNQQALESLFYSGEDFWHGWDRTRAYLKKRGWWMTIHDGETVVRGFRHARKLAILRDEKRGLNHAVVVKGRSVVFDLIPPNYAPYRPYKPGDWKMTAHVYKWPNRAKAKDLPPRCRA